MKKFLLLSFFSFLIFALQAQERSINGKVTSAEDGSPIPGVTVMVKGTSQGTITDVDGNFQLSVPSDAEKLVFSFVGMLTQEADIQNNMNIAMKQDVVGLEEVVVLGYGTRKKRDVIGSVAQVTGKEITSLASPSLDASLQGTASGLQVSSSSGTPGAIARVMIRGTNSLSSATEPLWVIDGIIVGSNLNNSSAISQSSASSVGVLSTINPNDIESVEVLKDAAATAIYGQRGSNGVIIITTKTGRKGVAESTVSVSTGVTTLTRHPDEFGLANTNRWFDIMETARANSGFTPIEYDPVVHGNVNSIDNSVTLSRAQALATNVNWFDQILRTGNYKDVNFSTTNGTEKGSYYFSGNYRKDESVIKNGSLERFSARSNMDFVLTEDLKLDGRFNFTYINNRARPDGGAPGGNNNTASGGFSHALETPPWMPLYDPGNPSELWNTLSGYNLVASNDPANIRTEAMKYRVLGGAGLTYNLPWVQGLSLRGEASVDLMHDHSIFWSNTVVRRQSSYAFDDKTQYRHLAYNIRANYDQTFGNHNISLVVGSESEMISTERSYIEGDQLSGTAKQVGNPANPLRIGSYFGGEEYLRGYFGRGNYKFMDKYLLGFSFRRDGTSNFIEENRWGTFSALSAGWILSDEAFMENISQINFMKLRGSFGQTGNANIPGGLDTPSYLDWMRYGERSAGVAKGTSFSGFAVRSVSWETTNSVDFGIDFGIFENRINGSIAYYNQMVEDMLLSVPIPISSGMFSWGEDGSIWANIGDMKNYGLEFNVNTINVNKNGFKWTSAFNITTNKNEILKLNPQLDEQGGGIISGMTVSRTGGSLGEWYLNEFAGIHPEYGYPLIYQADNNKFVKDNEGNDTEELNPNYMKRYVDPETGDFVIIPATNGNTNTNRIIHEGKTGMPTWFGGFSNALSYKGLELSFTFTFAGGNYIYDNVTKALHSVGGNMVNDLKEKTWSDNNKNATLPGLTADEKYDLYDDNGNLIKEKENFTPRQDNDQYLVKGDYIRLRTLGLNYTFNKNVVDKLKLKGLNAFVSANNLWTWTAEFEGYDPEGVGLSSSPQSRNLTQGVRDSRLPSLKSYNFGINITF